LDYYLKKYHDAFNDMTTVTIHQLGTLLMRTFEEPRALGHEYVSTEGLAQLLDVNLRLQVRGSVIVIYQYSIACEHCTWLAKIVLKLRFALTLLIPNLQARHFTSKPKPTTDKDI